MLKDNSKVDNYFKYEGCHTNEISFPLGGIGTGCIGLSGNGRLIDWEIFNRPNKGSINGFSHFAVKVEAEGRVLDARVLNGDLHPPYSGDLNRPHFESFGHGPHRSTLAGMPHFREVEFIGQYPVARLIFKDEKFPGKVGMTAFNPFIPLNDRDSGIPGAFFELEAENTLDNRLTFTFALSLNNPFASSGINSFVKEQNLSLIKLYSAAAGSEATGNGDMCIGTDAQDVSFQEYWYRGKWFNNLKVFWKDFTLPGKLKNRKYSGALSNHKHYPGSSDVCTLAVHMDLEPGEKKAARFVIT